MRITLFIVPTLLLCALGLTAQQSTVPSSVEAQPGASAIAKRLLDAAAAGRIEEVKAAINQGADVNARDGFGRTALLSAAVFNRIDVVKLLLSKGALVDAVSNERLNDVVVHFTPLALAADKGYVEVVGALLSAHANPNFKVMDVRPILMDAVEKGHVDVVSALLRAGADPNWVGDFGVNPLRAAASIGRRDIIRALMDAAANPGLPLNLASRTGDTKSVNLWLSVGADVNTRLGDSTPLISAARGGHVEVVKILLDKGAKLDMTDQYRQTALAYAAMADSGEIITLLVSKGADINEKNDVGTTAIMAAAAKNNVAALRKLIDLGADVNAKDSSGKTVLTYALQDKQSRVVQILQQVGAKQ